MPHRPYEIDPDDLKHQPFTNFKDLLKPFFALDKDKTGYILKINVPGYDHNSLKVKFYSSSIRVVGDLQDIGVNVIIGLPEDLDIDTLDCKVSKGVLTIVGKKRVTKFTEVELPIHE